MSQLPKPSSSNHYLADHVRNILDSYYQLTGRRLIKPLRNHSEMAKAAFHAPFFLASHGLENDPVLNYGNRYALDLFSMNWEKFTQTPSRYTAEEPNREERSRLLTSVAEAGYIEDYSGVRISSEGTRFRIEQATVWNVFDQNGEKIGQAATFSSWHEIG